MGPWAHGPMGLHRSRIDPESWNFHCQGHGVTLPVEVPRFWIDPGPWAHGGTFFSGHFGSPGTAEISGSGLLAH